MSYLRSKRFPELFKKRDTDTAPWWCFLPNPRGGRQLRASTGQRDDRAAHAWYLERVRAPHGSAVEGSGQKERSLRDALADRIEWLKSARLSDDPSRKKLAADTIDFYDAKSAPLLALLGKDTLLSAIGHEEIRRYIVARSKTCKATTIAKEFTTLSMAMRLARKDGVNAPIFAEIVPEDFAVTYVPKVRWLSENEVEAFAAVLAPKRVPLFLFLVCTGATYPSEVRDVRPGHVVKHVVHLPGTKSGARDRFVHVPSYGRKFLARAVRGLTPTGFESWTNIRGDLHDAARLLSRCPPCRASSLAWARHEAGATKPQRGDCPACARAAKVAPCSPNDLRRTFAQWLVRSGVPYELAAPMMGHGSTKMLEQVYGRRDARAVSNLVEIALKKAPKGARRAGG